jgi:hypothetical protein
MLSNLHRERERERCVLYQYLNVGGALGDREEGFLLVEIDTCNRFMHHV